MKRKKNEEVSQVTRSWFQNHIPKCPRFVVECPPTLPSKDPNKLPLLPCVFKDIGCKFKVGSWTYSAASATAFVRKLSQPTPPKDGKSPISVSTRRTERTKAFCSPKTIYGRSKIWRTYYTGEFSTGCSDFLKLQTWPTLQRNSKILFFSSRTVSSPLIWFFHSYFGILF